MGKEATTGGSLITSGSRLSEKPSAVHRPATYKGTPAKKTTASLDGLTPTKRVRKPSLKMRGALSDDQGMSDSPVIQENPTTKQVENQKITSGSMGGGGGSSIRNFERQLNLIYEKYLMHDIDHVRVIGNINRSEFTKESVWRRTHGNKEELCLAFYEGMSDPRLSTIKQIIREGQKILIIMQLQTLKTNTFVKDLDTTLMKVFVPMGNMTFQGKRYTVIVGFNLSEEIPQLDVLWNPNVEIRRGSSDGHSVQFYTTTGSWDFLTEKIIPQQWNHLFQNFYGEGHLSDQLTRLFPSKIIMTLNGELRHNVSLSEPQPEFLAALQEADIVITNPPYDMKYDYIRFLVDQEKPFILALPMTTILSSQFMILFGSEENARQIGIVLPLFRIQFFVPDAYIKQNPGKFQAKRIHKLPDTHMSMVKPNHDTIYVAWRVPSLEGRVIFLRNNKKEGEFFDSAVCI